MNLLNIFKKQSPKVKDIKSGRCGHLRFLEENRYADTYYELSGVPEFDLLVWVKDLKQWSNGNPITEEEKIIIFSALQEWANKKNVKCEW